MSLKTDAYAAGLIDGEGCISLIFHKNVYDLRIDVGMTIKAMTVLERLKVAYGGSVNLQREATDRWEAAYCWTVTGTVAAAALTRLQPYLHLKAEQAQVALKVAEVREQLPKMPNGSRRWTPEARERCAVLKRRMHELNRKGPSRSTRSPTSGRLIARLVAGQLVTDQGDLFSDLGFQRFRGPWPRSAIWDGSGLYELPMLEPLTAVSDGSASHGLLPTPQASDVSQRESVQGWEERQEHTRLRYGKAKNGLPLPVAARMLRTPTAQLAANGGSQHPDKRKAGGHGPTLADEVEHLLPTPARADGERASATYARGNPTLAGALLPTPSTADAAGGHKTRSGGRSDEPLLGGIAMLLPTPAAHDSANTPENHLRKKPGRSQVTSLQIIAEHGLIPSGGRLLPTPTAMDSHGARNATARRSAVKAGTNNDGWTLADVFWTGDLTDPLSPDGSTSPGGQLPAQPSLAEPASD